MQRKLDPSWLTLREAAEMLDLIDKVVTLLDLDAIPLLELRMRVGDLSTVAGEFEKAIAALVLPRREATS